MQSEAERLTEVLKYIKNLAMNRENGQEVEWLQHALWQINNVVSNALDLPYDKPAEFD